MISHLKGILEEYGEDWAVIDVNGVGYTVLISANTRENLPSLGDYIKLFIEQIIRNEIQQLCGFHDNEEKQWFRILLNVQGVGVKVALAILSSLSPSDLAQSISRQDSSLIQKTPGVGAKLANRIILELKDKKTVLLLPVTSQTLGNNKVQDALSALLTLGFNKADAINAIRVAKVELGEDHSTENLIKSALTKMHTA